MQHGCQWAFTAFSSAPKSSHPSRPVNQSIKGLTSATWLKSYFVHPLGHRHSNGLDLSIVLRNKMQAEIIFHASHFSRKNKSGFFFSLWGSQAHPFLIMRLYKDSIKVLNLLPNIEHRLIPGERSSARNSADVTLAWYVTWPIASGLYLRLIFSAMIKARLSELQPWQHDDSNYGTTDLASKYGPGTFPT